LVLSIIYRAIARRAVGAAAKVLRAKRAAAIGFAGHFLGLSSPKIAG
jgi:hypothetical protein